MGGLAERKAQEIASMDQRLQAALEAEQQARKESEMRVLRIFEDKTHLLKEEIVKRETMEQRMMARAMEEVQHLQQAILAEKKAREDTEEAMLRMMEDVVAKM